MSRTLTSLIEAELPHLARLLGNRLRGREQELERYGIAVLWQVEQDLELLERRHHVAAAYRNLLRKPREFVQAAYEIRTAAMLAPIVDELEPEPRVGTRKCDLKCAFGDRSVFIEVTTREDPFPWTRPEWNEMLMTGQAVDAQVRARATVERSYDRTTADHEVETREVSATKEIRDLIQDELRGLPENQLTVLVVGSQSVHCLDIERALFGGEGFPMRSPGLIFREALPNGIFAVADEKLGGSKLSAVVWMKLAPRFSDIRVHSRLFTNPRARRPMPPDIEDALVRVFDRRAVLTRELERVQPIILERYRPERMVLFGSMVDTSGEHIHSASDIDLFLVKSTPARYTDRVGEVLDLVEPRVGFNVIVYTPEELAAAEREGNFFVREEILGRGQVLFP